MTDLNRKLRLRKERLGLLRVVEDVPEKVSRIDTTFNGRQVLMSLPKVTFLERADATIKRLDGKTKP